MRFTAASRLAPALALALGLAGCEGTAPGRKAPGFSLPDPAGKRVALSEFRGRVVLLCFWGGWAPPCRLMLGDLAKLQRGRPAARFTVLAVAVDEDAAQVARDLKAVPVNYPVLVADEAVTDLFFKQGDLTVPLTLLLDARGVIIERLLGYRSEADLAPLVDKALGS